MLRIEPAIVTSVKSAGNTDTAYRLEVSPSMSFQEPRGGVTVAPLTYGSGYLPEPGDEVLIAYYPNGAGWVLKTLYTDSTADAGDVPTLERGEREESHPLSDARVRWDEDGTLHVDGDSDVVVNGGDTQPITDVALNTTTDGDGHVTDVSLEVTRAESTYVPSP